MWFVVIAATIIHTETIVEGVSTEESITKTTVIILDIMVRVHKVKLALKLTIGNFILMVSLMRRTQH